MTRWNRDVNAARNMRQIFIHMITNNKSRPAPFKHPGALDSEPGPRRPAAVPD